MRKPQTRFNLLVSGLVGLLALAVCVTPTEAHAPTSIAPTSITQVNTTKKVRDVHQAVHKQVKQQQGQTVSTHVQKSNAVSYTPRELELLTRLIYLEGRGEPFKGKIAIAAVVLNRVDSDQFADSIEEVIMTPGAFSVVHDGKLAKRVNHESKRAALAALRGEDPTNGALYFYNPKTATDDWIFSRPRGVTIGHHVFAF